MTEVSELNMCVEALRVLYLSGDSTQKQEANAWLEAFQRREVAWTVADQMVRRADLGNYAQYFGAQTLHTKIMRDFAQLPPGAHSSLEQSIIQLLQQFREGPSEIKTQLCLALADLVVQLGTWQDPLTDVVRIFGSDGPSALLLIDFLKVLPEEVDNRRVIVDDRDRRKRLSGYLCNCAPAFLSLVLSYLQTSGNLVTVHEKIFQCLHSWLRSRVVPVEAFANSSLLSITFEALLSEQLFDVAVDMLIEVISLTGDTITYRSLVLAIISQLLSHRERYSNAIRDEDIDKARGYTRMFVEACEVYLQLLVAEPDAARDLLDVLLLCLAHPDLDIAQMIFNFCYNAAHLLQDKEHPPATRAVFATFFSRVVDIIIGQLSYPLDSEHWTAERRDEFSHFRHTVGDTLKDCCLVLGSETCLQQVLARLEQTISRQTHWQTVEAVLFSLRSLAREVISQLESRQPNARDIPSMAQLMTILLSDRLPQHSKIRYTVTLIIGHYSPWSRLHPEFLGAQTNYILAGFSDPEVAPASALALKQLTQTCDQLLSGFVDPLLDFQQRDSVNMRIEDQLELTEAIANIVRALPENVSPQYWQRFSTPIVASLESLLLKQPAPPLSEIKYTLVSLIDRLSIFLRISARTFQSSPNSSSTQLSTMAFPNVVNSKPHPAAPVLASAWPILESIFERFGAVPSVMSSLCRCMRAAITSLKSSFLPFCDQLIWQLVQGYSKYKHCDYLYCGLVLVRTFGNIVEYQERFAGMITAMAGPTFALLSTNADQAFNKYNDVVQDFFALVQQCAKTAPKILLETKIQPGDTRNILPTLLSCCIAGIKFSSMDEAINANLNLINTLLYALYDTEEPLFMNALSPLVAENGYQLIEAVICGILNQFPPACIDFAAELLDLLFKAKPSDAPGWLSTVLNTLPASIPYEDRNDLLRTLLEHGDVQPVLRNLNHIAHNL